MVHRSGRPGLGLADASPDAPLSPNRKGQPIKKSDHGPRTVALLKRAGLMPQKTEWRDPAFTTPDGRQLVGRKHDAYEIADYIAVGFPFTGTIYIQTCSSGNVSARWNKALKATQKGLDGEQVETLRTLLQTGNRFWILGWSLKLTKIRQCRGRVHSTLDIHAAEVRCPKCKGRGYIGGRRRWEPKLWEARLGYGRRIDLEEAQDLPSKAKTKKEGPAPEVQRGEDHDGQDSRAGISGLPALPWGR